MLKTESNRYSKTMLIHLILFILGQSLNLVAWLQGVVSKDTWIIIAGVLSTVQTIAAMVDRMLSGQITRDGRMKGEAMKRTLPFMLLPLLLLLSSCATALPDFCAPEIVAGEPEPAMMCRPKEHRFEIDCWLGPDGKVNGGEIRQVGDGSKVYHRSRIKSGNPLEGLPGAKCPTKGVHP